MGAVKRRRAPILQDIFRQADELARSLPGMDGPLRLLANGGAYQDGAHPHFHLIAGSDLLTYRAPAEGRATGLETTDVLTVVGHPDPLGTTHLVVRSEGHGAAPAPFGPPGPTPSALCSAR
ncbi:MAG: hypothetical protein AVDCRST_MAG49-4552 [uncultured Thermomicrobiales bacterium]|uniref:Uncharacterized protein n=1 Tax=uncultured Thermomicrobiales bacterium TaxID=1645740 RepID=A0A6J4VKX5_9BACT|nr:MAG: hypothetical protein AVDCRST_MAG49-4552 [uncultured Thermomicrobiales bacterium]